MSKNDFSRRNFLKNSGLLASAAAASTLRSPTELIAGAMIKGIFNRAEAQAVSATTSKFYVNIMMGGGPLRYTFDHWLRTKTTDPALVFSSMTGTSFAYNSTSRIVSAPEYRTFDFNGTQIPQQFAALSTQDLNDFMSSFLVIRGYGSGVDGHAGNQCLQMQPLSGQVSTSGLIADASSLSYRAIQVPARGANSKYFSMNAVGQNVLNSTTPLNDLLGPLSATSTARTLRNANQDAFTQLRSALNLSSGSDYATTLVKSSLNDAYKLLQSNFGDYTTAFNNLKANYDTVIQQALRSDLIPGINATLDGSQSLQLIADGSSRYRVDGNPTLTTFTSGDDLIKTTDLMDIPGLSTNLALAEFCIVNNLSSAIEISSDALQGIRIAPGSGTTTRQVHDCHQSGDMASVLYFGTYFHALTRALLKFRERLVAAGKWSDTVVHLTSDFNRTVNGSGVGSDHGFNQMISSVFSGSIQGGPYVVGNIAASTNGFSQGRAVVIPGYSNLVPGPISMASTLYPLMGVSNNPWKNLATPLISLNPNGTLYLPYGSGKVVA
jgi:hypothetical protein